MDFISANSVEYYNKNSNNYYHRTINLDMSSCYYNFFSCVPKNSSILDIGCGCGRDSKFFLDNGHSVTAFDGSIKMVEQAKKEIKQEVMHLYFSEMNFQNEFDAAWACASLLHVPYIQQKCILEYIHNALKPEGIFFASYKYGKEKETVGLREFFNFNETSILPYLSGLFELLTIWTTPYTNQGFSDSSKKWLNFLVRAKK